MKTSILLTVHDREAAVILSTMRAIARCQRESDDYEVVIVNDRSRMSYDWLRAYIREREIPSTWVDITAGAYLGYRMDGRNDGHNGPSRAFNEALAVAEGERIIAMSSDILVTPQAWREALSVNPEDGMWSPKVWDLDANPFREYCGPTRVFPMPWFLVMSRKSLVEVGGWDEKYLEGLSYDDNDIAGRVALHQGRFFLDYEAVVFHQSHETVYARSQEPEVKAALDRNCDWTKLKWTGVPFDVGCSPFDVLRRPHPSGRIAFEVRAPEGRLERAVAMTQGMFAVQKAA